MYSRTMADQIVLAWTVSTVGSVLSPAQAQTAMAAVSLYANANTDPVLGQLFGLTVDADATAVAGTNVTRTLTLNMNNVNAPTAPPPFPCQPRTATPPTLPYPLRRNVALPGFFTVQAGSAVVATSMTQQPSLAVGDIVQFLSQRGVFYTIAIVGATSITLTAPYTGRTTANTTAFKEVAAPVTNAAIYSSCDLDTDGVATVPDAIPQGPGARTVSVVYLDSTGGGPFTATVNLTGRRPVAVTLDPGSVDIAVINNIFVASYGDFENSIGQITLAELTDNLPVIPSTATKKRFAELTDEAQLLIGTHLAYLPPSYFALAQQGASNPLLPGDLLVSTGSTNVKTTEDLTGDVSAGDTLVFASQLDKIYTVLNVGPKTIELTTAYSGLDRSKYDNELRRIEGGPVINQATGAFLVTPSAAAPPTNAQLAQVLAQYSETQTAVPPPGPPFPPATVPTPTFLSNLYTRTLSLALTVPVTPVQIAFLP